MYQRHGLITQFGLIAAIVALVWFSLTGCEQQSTEGEVSQPENPRNLFGQDIMDELYRLFGPELVLLWDTAEMEMEGYPPPALRLSLQGETPEDRFHFIYHYICPSRNHPSVWQPNPDYDPTEGYQQMDWWEYRILSGFALSFDGVDDFLEIEDDDSLDPINEMTAECWILVDPDDPDPQGKLISKWGDWDEWYNNRSFALVYLNNGALHFAISDYAHQWDSGFHDFTTDPGVVIPGQWTHVAGTFDGETRILYVNGVEVARVVKPSAIYAGIASVGIGAMIRTPISEIHNFHGFIDEARIWTRALSPDEILLGMYTSPPNNAPGLSGYWDFEEGEGQIAYDRSPFGNDATLGWNTQPEAADPEWVESPFD